mmetsp:Transcript_22880/g.25843  ORF Transcript_22880/g.25843 Transcript_22880/m.25843 type:complete len:148 (+) Transcript_22880:169-612(+)
MADTDNIQLLNLLLAQNSSSSTVTNNADVAARELQVLQEWNTLYTLDPSLATLLTLNLDSLCLDSISSINAAASSAISKEDGGNRNHDDMETHQLEDVVEKVKSSSSPKTAAKASPVIPSSEEVSNRKLPLPTSNPDDEVIYVNPKQ